MNRRGFLASCLALGAAPAIVRADSLMRIVPMETILVEEGYYEATVICNGIQNIRALQYTRVGNVWTVSGILTQSPRLMTLRAQLENAALPRHFTIGPRPRSASDVA